MYDTVRILDPQELRIHLRDHVDTRVATCPICGSHKPARSTGKTQMTPGEILRDADQERMLEAQRILQQLLAESSQGAT